LLAIEPFVGVACVWVWLVDRAGTTLAGV